MGKATDMSENISSGWRPVSCLKLRMMAGKLRKSNPSDETAALLEEAAADIERLAHASAELSVVVKNLDWQGYESRSVAGCYRVQRLDDKWEPLHDGYYMLPKQAGVVTAFESIDEAKAYAQSDFEARIRAALASTEGTEG